MAKTSDQSFSLMSSNKNEDEPISYLSDNVDNLKAMLRQESQYHKETGNCYDTLQKEYDDLLKKYAEAENTIDQYRIATKLNQKSKKTSPSGTGIGYNFKEPRSKSVQQLSTNVKHHTALCRANSLPETSIHESESTIIENQLKSSFNELRNDVLAFEGALVENEYLYEEKIQIYDALKYEFDQLMESFKELQRRKEQDGTNLEDSTGRISEELFDQESFEGELYQVGLRLEEINTEITEQQNRKDTLTASHKGFATLNDVFHENEEDVECLKVESKENISTKHSVHSDKHSNRSHRDSLKTSLSSRSNDIDERYLSQSFQPPTEVVTIPPTEVVVIGDTQTEASYFNQWSSRKPTSRNSNNKKTNHSNSARPDVSPSKPTKDITSNKTGEENRPNTMNSTEDSGFMEFEKSNSNINNNAYSTQPLNYELRHNNFDVTAVSNNRQNNVDKLPITPEEKNNNSEYTGKINLLRKFLNNNENSLNQSSSSISSHSTSSHGNSSRCNSASSSPKKLTPRSWVRGKSLPSQLHLNQSYRPSSQGSSTISEKVNSLERYQFASNSVKPTHQNKHSGQHRRSYSSGSIRNHTNNYSVDHRSSSDSIIMDQQPVVKASCSLEDLQEEMYCIKDLILDMRSSLSINQQQSKTPLKKYHYHSPFQSPLKGYQSSTQSPQKQHHHNAPSKHHKSNTQSPAKNYRSASNSPQKSTHKPLTPSRRKRLKSNDESINNTSYHDNDSVNKNGSDSNDNLNLQHLDVLKSLENKIERLSHKVDLSTNTKNDAVLNDSTTDVYDHVEKHEEKGKVSQNLMLENLAERIEKLSHKLHKKNKNEIKSESIKKDGIHEKMIKKIETNLEEINMHMNMKENQNSMQTTSNVSHMVPCPICRGVNTHIHGDYLHVGLDIALDNSNIGLAHPNNVNIYSSTPYHQHYADNVTNNNNTKESDSFGKYYNKSQNEKLLKQQQVNGNYPEYNRENISRSYTDHGINNRLARVNNESNVFHHYHSIHHSKKKPRNKYDTSREDENEDIQSTNHNALVFDEHVERSLANASFAAVNMEQISKRMLKSIATDLFNSGASEY